MSTETTKNNNWVWWVLGSATLGAIIYAVWKYTSLPAMIGAKVGGAVYNQGGGLLTDYGDTVNTDKVLTFGEKSNNVIRLQTAINETIDKFGYNYTKLSVDGVFGNKTLEAIKYLSNNTLTSGTVTVNKIYNLPKLIAYTGVPFTGQPAYTPPVENPDYTDPFAKYRA